ncbi:MAG: DUF3429 domain-containing protein [Litoreibacter sp.]|nr:DUF3429 domain-containing protein [Litoreibacter sp.]MCY4333227.1 DUF3429 domain-containing protein [Litoreibacter sp.]
MIPRAPLLLGLAGLLPFLWAAAGILIPSLSDATVQVFGARFNAPYVLIAYGTVILCFMSGVLWGFAVTSERALPYAVSVIPALWAFFAIGGGEAQATSAVIVGFILVYACDLQFANWGLTPPWWIKLRTLLTVIVLACLLVGQLA